MSDTTLSRSLRYITSSRTPQRDSLIGAGENSANAHEFSISFMPSEAQRMLDYSQLNASRRDADTSSFSELSLMNHPQKDIFKEWTDMLFPQFLQVLETRASEGGVFTSIEDLIHYCTVVLDRWSKETQWSGNRNYSTKADWLELECKTWKLLYALYKDRTLLQQSEQDIDFEIPITNCSEKEVITQLYNWNSTLREYQLIIDWLEACCTKKHLGPEVGHTTDQTVGWENTLFQLQREQEVAFSSGCEIVKSLDPDAPIREKKPLHALDEEDNKRLSRCIFQEVRQGRIDDALALCKYCGQTWRAVILEGWRLHEDPNYGATPANSNERLPIEGNPRRDVWKKCAWMMADSKKYDQYTRAIAGTFCGHLKSLTALLSDSWEDLLWAYLKVQVDIRVECEIRSKCVKRFHPLPEEYWNAKMSMEQVFDELMVHKNADVRNFAQSKMGTILKYIILDDIPALLQQVYNWIEEDQRKDIAATQVTPHMLRFLAHLVLFMRQIGKVEKEDVADRIITAYVECLIGMKNAQMVSFYTAALPKETQVTIYSKFLEAINETTERQQALEEAINAELEIENITRYTVETIRQKQQPDTESELNQSETLQQGDISAFDQWKIKALEWLSFLPSQRGELLWQGNAMIRSFLAENKMECVRAVYAMIPEDALTQIITYYGNKNNLPYREECSIMEYLSYKVYLTALDTFDDWYRLYHNCPKQPQQLTEDAKFTERMALEHREQVYQGELSRWNSSLESLSKDCRDAFFNILLFPEKGWLNDPVTPNDPEEISHNVWENRQNQLDNIRSICIPEITLLLHKVLQLSNDHQGCVRLADEIASENGQLYKLYTKHKLAELLSKLAESSLELLNEKLDPWGFPVTV